MNNIFINNNDIDGLHFGSSSVSKVFFGSNLVYEDVPPIPNYLQFTAKNGNATIGLHTATTSPNVSYSFDGETWTTWNYSNITLSENETIYMKGNNSNGFNSVSAETSANRFVIQSGDIECHGSVQSLIYGDDFETGLTIPNNYCFAWIFDQCTNLLTAPDLPATSITQGCYFYTFNGCENLTTVPTTLPAMTLQTYCYRGMFQNCYALQTAPQLPATTLTNNCYELTFNNCSGLTQAPVLPAITLKSSCYRGLFKGCSSLNYIKAMFTTTPSTTYTENWVSGVASSGTYVKNSSASYTTRGVNAIPNNWTIRSESE